MRMHWSATGAVGLSLALGLSAGCKGSSGASESAEESTGDTGDEGPPPDCPPPEYEDELVELAVGSGSEVVDVEFDGTRVYLCGGFGMDITDVSDPGDPDYVGTATPRCQNTGIGPVLPDGSQVFWAAHHGDSWEAWPYLRTFRITPEGNVASVDSIDDTEVLFEGMDYADGHLYVAVHGGGVRVYAIDDEGVPTFVTAVAGFDNATKVEIADGVAYVADGIGGIRVLSLDDPAAPLMTGTVEVSGLPRNLELFEDTMYVALGGDGIAIYDISDPLNPELSEHIDTMGSVQAVDRDGDVIAVAAWSHTALYDAQTFELLATERTKPPPGFEQDLGVALTGDHVFVGEWEGLHVLEYRPGLSVPDVWLDNELFSFPDEDSDKVVLVRNVGTETLDVCDIRVANDAYTIDFSPMSIEPGEAGAFEISFSPPAGPELSYVEIRTNDPDPAQADMRVLLDFDTSEKLGVGDQIDESFAFLGGGDLSALEGKVTVLAYFALF